MKINYKLILPVFNEKRLKKILDYYLNDIGTSANLIIIDSFSNDNTPRIIKEYCKKFKNVKYIQKKNQGTTETQEYMNWFLENVISDYYIFLSCSEIITRDTFELFNNYMKKEIDLLYVNRKSILNGRDISYVYSKLIELILFKKTYMPLCRLASNSALKKIKTSIHDNWLSESHKVNSKFIKNQKYNILHYKNNSFRVNSLKHLDYAKLEQINKFLIYDSILKIVREILYLIILLITFRLNKELIQEFNLRIIYHLQKIHFKIE